MSDPLPLHRIGRQLGRGAVASVHEVFDDEGRRYAGKLLHASRDGDTVAAARFAQEAALLAGIDHPNLVRVDGEAEGVDEHGQRRSFVRMELVDGLGLDELLARRGPLAHDQAVEFARQLAAGLAHAHGRGIVHRDLKPANVLVDDPEGTPVLKIADFGMARASSLSGVSADALTILGTPDYMAPESLDPIAVDARADLYALGCMLYEMLTGRVPYPAATPFGILRRHRDDPLPELDDSVAPELRAVVHALLAKSPADRPSSAGTVAERLARIAAGPGTTALELAAPTVNSRCVRCDHSLVEHINVCLNCGLSTVHITPGDHSVVIVGPGEVGDKLDTALRGKLLEWLESNPQLGLDPDKALTKRIPRMPVVLASRVSERSAEALIRTLQVLGFAALSYKGLAIKHPLVRKKTTKIAGRIGVIALTSMGGMWQFGWAAVALAVGAIGAILGSGIYSARAVTSRGQTSAPLGPGLRAAFDRVEAVAGSLEEPRHRHALRAVVRQSLDLRELLGPEHSELELASAVDRASATTAALARIDAELRTLDLHDGGAETRALLHERDQLAGRMAELSGSLEALRIRARRGSTEAPGEHELELEDLRDRVEALEEVMAS